MTRLVMKFGGTSVATLDRIRRAAKRVGREVANGHEVIVIVSAMAGKTNELVGWVNETSPFYDAREYDAVVSSGENVTAGLMALTLQEMDIPARSWQGWQVPLITNGAHGAARIDDIPTANMDAKFAEGMKVAVVAGFQGISPEGRITTLGRGGSDTTAVAFAAAHTAVRCDIYTDVDGVYTTDPRVSGKARKLDKIAFEEMLELASLGAKVLQTRSVELAMRFKVRLRVLSSFDEYDENAGTLVCDEEEIMESKAVAGVAFSRDEAKMTLISVADKPGIAAAIFGPLAEAGVNVDMIVQNISEEGRTDMTFSCPVDQVKRAEKAMAGAKDTGQIEYSELVADTDVAKVSVVGIGMRSHAGVAARMFQALRDENINIKVITTSEIKISVLIDRKYMELAVQALHDCFELEKAEPQMRILCLNTWGGTLYEALVPFLASVDADVICLQEVVHSPDTEQRWLTYRDGAHVLKQRANLFHDLRAALPDHTGKFCPAAKGVLWDNDRPVPSFWGLATFVKTALPEIGRWQGFIHKDYDDTGFGAHPRSRGAHGVRVFQPGIGPVSIAHLHGLRDPAHGKFDTPARRAQAEKIAQIMPCMAHPGDVQVLCGDFNLLPNSTTFALLAATGLHDLVSQGGFTGTRTAHYTKPERFADYMLVNDLAQVQDFDVIAQPEVSDHCPLLLTLRQ